MPDDRHEARRAIAAWKVARYERKLTLAISAALAAQRAKLARFTPGTPPPDPLDLATWQETVNQHVEPTARSVLSEIARDVGKAAGLGVAYRAKPGVAAGAAAKVDHGDLTAVLYFQGYRRDEFAAI